MGVCIYICKRILDKGHINYVHGEEEGQGHQKEIWEATKRRYGEDESKYQCSPQVSRDAGDKKETHLGDYVSLIWKHSVMLS
jgi:hypothetical protein